MNVWLEVRPCAEIGPAVLLDVRVVQEIPVLAEALAAAQQANTGKQHSAGWDYSIKVVGLDLQRIKDTVDLARVFEDWRSIIFSADVSYCNLCYTLSLFVEKSQ